MPRNPLDPPDDTITSGPTEGVNEREPLPRTVGRFEVHSLLGEGGTARVYRAFDPTLDRLVALKVLHAPAAGDADAGAQQRKRILREARAAAALTHPNTVTIYEVGEADGQPFIAMELLGGTTLRAAARGDAGPATRFRWLLEAARALHAAHERGLVHRDVKPDNMIVEPDGRLKLLDFGIAKRDYGDAEAALAEIGLTPPDGPSSMRTAEGRRIGTPRYMAPEQWSGESTNGRTDQYAWGLVAVELLTGVVPREGTDVAAELRAHSTPEHVIAVVLRALAPKQNDRAPSMLPVIEALERGATTTPARDALPLAPRVESHDELRRAASIARTVEEPPSSALAATAVAARVGGARRGGRAGRRRLRAARIGRFQEAGAAERVPRRERHVERWLRAEQHRAPRRHHHAGQPRRHAQGRPRRRRGACGRTARPEVRDSVPVAFGLRSRDHVGRPADRGDSRES